MSSSAEKPESFLEKPSARPAAEHLLNVAGEIFAAKGPAATVREICRAAGCSIAAINYYFGDKQQLYVRCVQTACEQKQRLFPLPDQFDPRPPPQLLRSYLRALTARIAGQSNATWHNALMLREVLEPAPEIAELLSSSFQPDMQLLEQHLGRLLGADLNSQATRRQLILQILARCMFLRTGRQLRLMLSLSAAENESPEQYADEICDSILLQIDAMRTVRRRSQN